MLDIWLGPRCASGDWYITVLKIQRKIYVDGRQVKMESFESTISFWIQAISWPLKQLSKYLWQCLFLIKSYAYNRFFWTHLDGCVCIMIYLFIYLFKSLFTIGIQK